MARKAGLLTGLTVALGLGLPLQAQVAADLPSQIRADLDVLSSEPTLMAWQRSHPGEKIEPAHYETEKEPFELDFERMNRWCAVSVASLQTQAVRAALFYVPSVASGDLPPLPANEDSALIRRCRMQAIWYETSGGDVSMDALVSEFSSYWGKPNGQTTTPDIPGSALWKRAVAWHRSGMNIWTVYDVNGKPGGAAGPRLIVYARRDIPPDEDDLELGPLGYGIRNRMIETAAQMAAQDPALTAAVLDRSRYLSRPLKLEPESVAVSRLARWLEEPADAAPTRRAATLLVAHAYVTCAPVPPQALIPLGATLAIRCPEDGAGYDGNLLREAEKLDPKGPAGELAGLASLGEPCFLKGRGSWPDLVIEKGEMLLRQFPPDQWTPWIHFAIARAHAEKLSFTYRTAQPEDKFSPLTPAARREEQRAAIEHFEDLLRARLDGPEAVFAWQEAWRLLAGLPPSRVHFSCGCE